MKNIFRVRTPQTVEVFDGNGAETSAPLMASMSEAAMVESTQPVPPPMSDFSQSGFNPAESEPVVAVSVEESQPMEEPQLMAQVEEAQPTAQEEPVPPPPVPVAAAECASNWAAEYVVPEMEGIIAEIQELKQFIQDMEQRKTELERKVSDRSNLRDALLAGSGATLKNAVQQVFNEMGITIQTSGQDGMNVILEHKGLDVVTAITAGDGPLTLADVRQLNHFIEDFIEAHGRQPKGLVVANPFFDVPLEARTSNGHVAFPEELRLLAEQRYKFGLLTAPQLFVAYCKFKEGQLDINEFMSELFENVWVYGNHCDFDRFKASHVAA